MNPSNKLLSDIVAFRTYAKHLTHLGRRESLAESINRNMSMHLDKFPKLSKDIIKAYQRVHDLEVMPSMRALQFSGDAILKNNIRQYNCFKRSTEFITDQGVKSFLDFEDGDVVNVLSDRGFKKATVRNFGEQYLYELVVQRHSNQLETIQTTANHRWITVKGNIVTEKTTANLTEKDILKYSHKGNRSPVLKACRVAMQHGMVFGDGTKELDGSTTIVLCGNSVQFQNLFSTGRKVDRGIKGGKVDEKVIIKNLPYNWKLLPDINSNKEYLLGFMAGWFGADGYIDAKGSSIILASANKDNLVWARGALSKLNIFTQQIKIQRELSPYDGSYKPLFVLSINASDLFSDFFLKKEHKERFKTKSEIHWRVKSVKRTLVKESVWCVQEPEKEMFTLANGIVTKNCSAAPIDDIRAFGEALYLLLSGVGFGFSVQKMFVDKLPKVQRPNEEGFFVVQDSIMGWAQALDLLIEAYFLGRVRPQYDFGNIRPKGSYLVTTGAKAPGPEPLKKMLELVEAKLKVAIGRKLRPIEVHDIVCIISDSVLAGGIRRAALISLFDSADKEMLTCKHGEWWNSNPWRARANNSAVLHRDTVTKEEFDYVFDMCKDSKAGEPGFFFTNDFNMLTNPCCFSGDTLLSTDIGTKTFAELSGTSFTAINMAGEKVPATVWETGIKSTVQLRLSNGEKLVCTPDHRFMTTTGEEVEAKDLEGIRIMPFIKLNKTNNEFTKLGFIQGDGVLSRLNSKTHKGLEVNIGYKDADVASIFGVELVDGKRSYYLNEFTDILVNLQFDAKPLTSRGFPETFNEWTKEQQLSFLRGMYSANGSIIKGARVAYKTTSLSLVGKLTETLTKFNIANYTTVNKAKEVKFTNGTYVCKESYDINITQYESVKLFAELIGFVHGYKQDKLVELIKDKAPMVRKINEAGKQTVYDFSLQDAKHWGVVGSGLIAHNCEIALQSNQFCNLSTINQTGIRSDKDFFNRVYAASLIGTLQASYTDFSYLRPVWRETTEREALLGVSFTGIADAGSAVNAELLTRGAELVKEVNAKYAAKLGINVAARTTTVKPEGSSSCVLGSSSGIHARHNDYYIRRIRMNKDDALAVYLKATIPALVEDDALSSSGVVVSIPQESPAGATTRHQESALSLLDRTLMYRKNWIEPGHRSGNNKHNVSVTISVADNEWDELKESMWANRNHYSGISLLPLDTGSYKQAPFEDCSKDTYEQMSQLVKEIDLKEVREEEDKTTRVEQIACGGGSCEIT